MVSFIEEVCNRRIVAIVRGQSPVRVQQVCEELLDSGIKIIEVPLTTPNATDVIRALRAHTDQTQLVGAGTVLDEEQLDAATQVGAQFIVTPALTAAVGVAVRRDVPVLAGAYSATEVHQAMSLGVDAVKLFPAMPVGPAYLKALLDPFPGLPIVPVGGVGLREAVEFLQRGAVGVGVGGPLVGDAVAGGDLRALRERARAFLEAVADGV